MRASRILGWLGVAVVGTLSRAGAQDQVVVFQHGFFSDSSTWGPTPLSLRQQYKIKNVLTTTSWCRSYTTQAQQLPTQLPPSYGDTLSVIGHSNGGLVARNYSRIYGRTNRIASLGTPHLGAPLATNVLNGNVWSFGRYMWQTIGSVMSYYNFYDDGQSMPFGFNEVYAPVMWWMGSNMQPLFASNGWGLDRVTRAWCPAILDMQPSARIRTDTLNSSANLAREAGALRARVSIVADKSPINGLFSMLWANDAPTRNGWINARWGFYAGAIASYWGYSRSSDPLLRQRANDFLSLAALMIDLDFWYAKLTGSLIAYQRSGNFPFDPSYTLVAPGDLIVPLGSQRFPAFTKEYLLQGYSHMQQTRSPQAVAALLTAMGQDFGMPVRPVGSVASIDLQPPTLTLSQSGTYQMSASTRDINGLVLTGKPVAWVSSAPSVATVSGAGLVTAITSSGAASIVASSGGYADTSFVTVAPSIPFTSVAIRGPSVLIPSIDGTFSAVPSGGNMPIGYVWKVNGVQRGTGTTFAWAATAAFTLTLVATDSRGITRSATKNVTISNCGGGC